MQRQARAAADVRPPRPAERSDPDGGARGRDRATACRTSTTRSRSTKGPTTGSRSGQPVVTGSADSPRLVGQVVSVTPISSDVAAADRSQLRGRRRPRHLGCDRARDRARAIRTSRWPNIPTGTKFPEGRAGVRLHVTYDIGGQHGRYPPNILIGEVSSVHEGVQRAGHRRVDQPGGRLLLARVRVGAAVHRPEMRLRDRAASSRSRRSSSRRRCCSRPCSRSSGCSAFGPELLFLVTIVIALLEGPTKAPSSGSSAG